MRGALYARYSTDRQSETSPEDQARLCGARAMALGIEIVASFEDRAVSGGIPISARAGGRSLLAGAIADDFDVILVEGLDRLSRDLVDQERVVRRLEHAGLRIIGVKDGYDSSSGKSRKILRQVRGMINEIYRDDAGENTRRGQIGQFHRGFHAGGMCFGYRTVAVTGGRRLVIDLEQARTVVWLFERAGIDRRSDGWIADKLNACGVQSKRGGQIAVPKYVDVAQPAPPKRLLFAQRSDEELLSYGVPTDWLGDVRKADEDTLLELAGHLPSEAAEALLELATGGQPQIARATPAPGADPFAHPDAQRRFRVMSDVAELERALEYPWDKWTIFLHPAQRQ